MKKNILIYGLILGAIMTVNMFVMVDMCYNNPDFKSNDVLGYAAMIIIFSLLFFGVRSYRNNQLNGFISFGQAFKMGTIIAFVGATLYVVVWLFYYYLFVPDFLDHYIPHVILDATRNGATEQELADLAKDMADFKEMYKNTWFVILTTYFEVLPVGIVVALISALILKKKPKIEPQSQRDLLDKD